MCPRCEKLGEIQILGEIKEDGSVDVMRFHQSSTRIGGGDFAIFCGRCGEKVFFKESDSLTKNETKQEKPYFRHVRIYRATFVGKIGV